VDEETLELDGSGFGYGYGYGSGFSYGSGFGSGSGYGYGYGDGYGDGYGSGYGYGYGSGDGSGDGYGSGYGYGYGSILQEYLELVASNLDAQWVLKETNSELKRMMIEAMGADNLFRQLKAVKVIHTDVDGYCNPRSLLRIPLEEAQAGYLQAVKVVCPTTGRVYYLGVPPEVRTCQEAVASTFGIKADDYHPGRET
jgi:hypothetical protein